MSERKTIENNASVPQFIKSVENETRRKDAKVVAKIMRDVSGKRAKMWGPSIVGFGRHDYTLANGKDESICKIGFSPRKTALTFYLGNFNGRAALLKKLGKHKMSGGGCMYVNKLDDVDMGVLEKLISGAWNNKRESSGC